MAIIIYTTSRILSESLWEIAKLFGDEDIVAVYQENFPVRVVKDTAETSEIRHEQNAEHDVKENE
jgi:hypothetical protein